MNTLDISYSSAGNSDTQQRLNTVLPAAVDGRRLSAKSSEAAHRRKEEVTIATWNVRTLYAGGKLANVIREAERNKVDILGMSEVRWTGFDRITSDGYDFIYSGGEKHENGVGILVSKKLSAMIEEMIPISDRVMAVVLNCKPKPLSIIQVYLPTSEHNDDEIEAVYEDIEKVLKKIRRDSPIIMMGDFNAKVGKGSDGE
jgi:exonuclease III